MEVRPPMRLIFTRFEMPGGQIRARRSEFPEVPTVRHRKQLQNRGLSGSNHGDRTRCRRRMGQGNLDLEPSVLAGQARRQSVELDGGPTGWVARDFDFTPADGTRAWQRLERLVDRLLSGDPRRGVTGRVGPRGEIGALVIGEEPQHGLLTLVRQQPGHAIKIHEVHADTDHVHTRAHQNAATP